MEQLLLAQRLERQRQLPPVRNAVFMGHLALVDGGQVARGESRGMGEPLNNYAPWQSYLES